MVPKRVWTVINVSLGLVAFVLLLNLLGVSLPTLGQAYYQLDKSDPVCVVSYKGETSLLPNIDWCCGEIRQELIKGEPYSRSINVEGEQVTVNKRYYTSENTVNYFINMKTYYYCKNNGFLV